MSRKLLFKESLNEPNVPAKVDYFFSNHSLNFKYVA